MQNLNKLANVCCSCSSCDFLIYSFYCTYSLLLNIKYSNEHTSGKDGNVNREYKAN